MDTSDNPGIAYALRFVVLDADLRRRTFTYLRDFNPEGLAGLLKTISQGDPTLENSLLRRWRVR